MTAETERSYVLGRLILDYIRTFMWPAVVLLAAVIYQDDLMGILKGREFKAFGVEIGQTVQQLQHVEATTQEELDDIAALVETLQASYQRDLAAAIEQIRAENGTGGGDEPDALPSSGTADALAEDIDIKISSLRQNLDREVQQIQQTATRAPLPRSPAQEQPRSEPDRSENDMRGWQAAALERAGFEAILARDFDAALEAFSEARRVWPTYNNVAEIQRRLAKLKKRGTPLDAAKWAEIDRALLTEFSWGMPPEIRAKFREKANEAYEVGATRG